MNDSFVMGKKPEVKRIINATIDKVKAIADLADDSNVKYLFEEVIADLEDLKLEIHKLQLTFHWRYVIIKLLIPSTGNKP